MRIGKFIMGLICVLMILFITVGGIKYFKYGNDEYYAGYMSTTSSGNNSSKYVTVIDHTTKVKDATINSESDSIKLIQNEASLQEGKCNNNINYLEKDLSEYTNIYGVNFCEIDSQDVVAIVDTIKNVFEKFPDIRNFLTNVSIVNDGGTNSYIAAFKPAYTFATSNNSSKYPFVIKMQLLLNASYYLNDQYLDNVIKNAVETNYFPKDTTKESLVAHELGHALTYILDIKYNNSVNTLLLKKEDFKKYTSTLKDYTENTFSKKIYNDAYLNYCYKYGNISEEEFRKNISLYADSKDAAGNVIYNETIAEAFHDYYLHGDKAKKESIEIMNVLNQYL